MALAALGSAAAYITKTLSSIAPLTIVLSILGAILLAMLPMSVVAFLKLRRRDLSAILEGSGWAINARMRLTRKQGRFFTKRPGYPQGSTGIRSRKWGWYLLILLLLTVIIVGGYLWHNHTNKSQSPPPEIPASQAK